MKHQTPLLNTIITVAPHPSSWTALVFYEAPFLFIFILSVRCVRYFSIFCMFSTQIPQDENMAYSRSRL